MNFVGITCTLLLAVAAVLVNAEPPKADAAPYPPSGWRPSGRQFTLPLRQAPRGAYNAPPKEQYGPPKPAPSYGPPSTTATTTTTKTTPEPVTTARSEEVDETTEETTDEPDYRDEEGAAGGARAISVATVSEQEQEAPSSGVYYVLLPDNRLQRVAYTTAREQQRQVFQRLVAQPQPLNQGYLAVHYEDVQPIQAPVYSVGPDNTLIRIYRK